MNRSTAERRIFIHAGFVVSKREPGLLGRLRPYSRPDESIFAELIHCLIVIHPTISTSSRVDRKLCAALWTICDRARIAMGPNGMLQRNKLGSVDDLAKLERWVHAIEYFCTHMMCGNPIEVCCFNVVEYIAELPADRAKHFVFASKLLAKLGRCADQDIAGAAILAATAIARGASALKVR